MAELAIGISKTAVEALVNKVKSAIKEEAEKWQILQRDIVFIRDEFEMMQSFLNTTGGERMKNLVATTWVRQVRDLSYDTEDCIEFVLHLDTKRWTFRQFFSRLLRPNVLPTTIPLDQAIAEIKQLKAQAEDVKERNIRYSLTGSSREQMLPTSSANHSTPGIFIEPNHTCILDLARLIATEGNGLQVISVCGVGGDLGTSSIIKKAYDDPKICKMFECRAWVKLMHPLNPHEFIRSLLAGFYANFPGQNKGIPSAKCSHTRWGIGKRISTSRTLTQFTKNLIQTLDLQDTSGEQEADLKVLAAMKASQDSIARDFIQIIKKRPYLIILEDLTSIVEWNSIRTFIPDMKNRSRIVVSTQHLEIANLCTGRPNNDGLLRNPSTDDSVRVLFKKLPRNPRFVQGCERRKRCTKQEAWALQRESSLLDEHWQKEHKLFGRKSEMKELFEKLRKAFGSRATNKVISLWGVAGVGKSFLIEAFYDHYTDTCGSSAVVSAAHPFDIMNLCQDLAHDLKLKNGEDIFLQIRSHLELEDNTCLVVVDDLQSKEDWDSIEGNLISGALSRSCIIVITREESVARHCARSDDEVLRVKGLDETAAHHLLEKKIDERGGGNSTWDATIKEDAKVFVNSCGRIPKLTIALVDYLADVPNPRLEMQRLNTKFMIALNTGSQGLDSYFSSKNGLDSFQEVVTWTYSNFRACPPLLRKCVFYLSIFTQTTIIRRNRLVRRWIAEGYSEGTDSNSTVEYTENLVRKLANLGIIDHTPQAPTVTGDEASCQINSFFLQYVLSRETEENIFLPLEISVLHGEGYLNPQGQRAGQHLAIRSSWKRDKFVYDNLDFSRLRSLTVSREWRPFLISDRMRVLRVLDLEETNVNDDDIKQITKLLHRLKFLCLRRCTKVSFLPESLRDLRLLQTLDIRHTSVTRLPKSIYKLQQLQYIRAATRVVLMEDEPSTPWRSTYHERTTPWRSNHGYVDACDGIMVPGRIGALTALHTLGVINVSIRGGKAILKDLKKLTQLHKLGVSGINRSNIKALSNAIVGHRHLESLSLQLHMDEDLEWLGKITPPGNLRCLKMYIHVVKYPHWSCLQILGQIRRLQTLRLRLETDQDVDLQFTDMLDRNASGQFCELKVLEIACSSNLHLKFAAREMHELEMLNVHCLSGSSLQLSGIQYPPSLKHVWLKGSFDETVKEELRRKVAQNPNKPVCKLV